jgi:hypothetical protein
MKLKVERMGWVHHARFRAVLGGCWGLVAGVLYGVGGLLYDAAHHALGWGTSMAFGAAGWLSGALEIGMYNAGPRCLKTVLELDGTNAP